MNRYEVSITLQLTDVGLFRYRIHPSEAEEKELVFLTPQVNAKIKRFFFSH